jgi:hypothetical protein
MPSSQIFLVIFPFQKFMFCDVNSPLCKLSSESNTTTWYSAKSRAFIFVPWHINLLKFKVTFHSNHTASVTSWTWVFCTVGLTFTTLHAHALVFRLLILNYGQTERMRESWKTSTRPRQANKGTMLL